MMRLRTKKKTGRLALVVSTLLAIMASSVQPIYADHGDAPTPGQDQATAIGDISSLIRLTIRGSSSPAMRATGRIFGK